MKKLRIFYLEGCPYCAMARRAVRELAGEPEVAGSEIEWIDERAEAELADAYDYYYVPSVFDGDRKLYEARPSHGYGDVLAGIRAALRDAREQ